MIGESVGNFRVTRLLGEGGMGRVYLAEHPGLGRRAAVKVLHADLTCSEDAIQRFFNEARAANAIRHRGIVEALDFGRLPAGSPYIVMEYLEGESLAARLRRAGRLPLPFALEIAEQAAEALGAAHRQGVVHRDLKPDNIFLTADPDRPGWDLVKVLDFGIAKLARPAGGSAGEVHTRTGTLMGTPLYMSPEQCRDARDVDHRSDIYSLGCVIHEMVAGAAPFDSRSPGELAHLHIGVAPPRLRHVIADVPEELERAVLRALEKAPAARFQSMAELCQALGEVPDPRVPTLAARADGPGATLRLPPDRAAAPSRRRRTTFGSAAGELGSRGGGSEGRARKLRWVAAGTLGALAIAAVAVRAARTPAPAGEAAPLASPSESAATPAPTAAPAPTPAPAPTTPPAAPSPPDTAAAVIGGAKVSVRIVTVPSGARVVRERDGTALGSTPLQLAWPRGSGREALRLEQDGYRDERLTVPLDRGLSAEVQLQRTPATSATAGVKASASGHERRDPIPRPQGTPRPQRPQRSERPGEPAKRPEPLKI